MPVMSQLRFAFRTLFRTPFVSAVAVLSLGLGIGANAAIFSLFDQLMLRRLPVTAPGQLVNLSVPGPKAGSTSCSQAGPCEDVLSYPMFRDLEREQTVFTGLAAHRSFDANLAQGGETTNGTGMLVSGSYFPVLGIAPELGRLLGPGDDRVVGESRVVVLNHEYWRRQFGERRTVEGETLIVNGQAMTIIGVAPAGFNGTTLGERPDIYLPITMRGVVETYFRGFDNRRAYWIYAFGRLKPGVTIDAAATALNVPYRNVLQSVEAPLQSGMSEATLERFRNKLVTLAPGARGQSSINQEARTPLIILFAVTGVVLLIACANIANLLLARSATRAGEMAVRLSIGASRGQLIRQLLTESVVLAVMGGAVGLVFARWTLLLIASKLPADATNFLSLQIDPTVMGFAAALSVVTGLLFGLFPALHSTRPNLAATLKGVSGQPAGARSASFFRSALVAMQVTLSMLLLAMAGLFLKSLVNVSRVDLGLSVDRLVTFGLSPRLNGYAPERSRDLFVRAEDALAAMPGVSGVAASMVALLAGSNWGSSVTVQGFEAGPDTDTNSRYNEVSPGYFRTMGITMLSGRDFTHADTTGARKVAIVNETFAKKFNLGRDAVGRLMSQSRGNAKLDIEIVGLVQDAKYSEVKGVIPPLFFLPYRQDATIGDLNFYVRSNVSTDAVVAAIPGVVRQLDATLPVTNLRTMTQQIEQNVFMDRMLTTIATSFAGLATLLASIGLYGVLAYSVSQRTREFGLRMALGAAPGRVRWLVLKQFALLTAIGAAIGLSAAGALGSAAKTVEEVDLLYQVNGIDPVVFGSAAALLTLVALAASFVPALRASRLDPMRALRYE
jgi:predicted permease